MTQPTSKRLLTEANAAATYETSAAAAATYPTFATAQGMAITAALIYGS